MIGRDTWRGKKKKEEKVKILSNAGIFSSLEQWFHRTEASQLIYIRNQSTGFSLLGTMALIEYLVFEEFSEMNIFRKDLELC